MVLVLAQQTVIPSSLLISFLPALSMDSSWLNTTASQIVRHIKPVLSFLSLFLGWCHPCPSWRLQSDPLEAPRVTLDHDSLTVQCPPGVLYSHFQSTVVCILCSFLLVLPGLHSRYPKDWKQLGGGLGAIGYLSSGRCTTFLRQSY